MKLTATVEEDEAKMIAAIDIGGTKDGADDPDANKDGSDSDGKVMVTAMATTTAAAAGCLQTNWYAYS